MSRDLAYEVFDNADYGVLAFCMDGEAYSVPLSLVRKGDVLYFHSAKAGLKVDLARAGGRVSVTAVGRVQVPDFTSKETLDAILADPKKHYLFGELIFTTSFESAHAFGEIREILDPEEKIEVLRILCEKYTPDKMDYFQAVIGTDFKSTAVFAIDMEEVTGKRKIVQPGEHTTS